MLLIKQWVVPNTNKQAKNCAWWCNSCTESRAHAGERERRARKLQLVIRREWHIAPIHCERKRSVPAPGVNLWRATVSAAGACCGAHAPGSSEKSRPARRAA